MTAAFELNDQQVHLNPQASGEGEPEVRGVALDRDQAQVSVRHVPDKPGTAASLCTARPMPASALIRSCSRNGNTLTAAATSASPSNATIAAVPIRPWHRYWRNGLEPNWRTARRSPE